MRDVYFIGVDSGTQSTKVSIINQRGEILPQRKPAPAAYANPTDGLGRTP